MRDRYYSSELHRFLSLDKDQGDLYRPSTLNPYAYVGNDPINFIDPSGMTAVNIANALKNAVINEDGSLNWGGLADIGLNVVGLIPGVGDLAKASKLGKNAIKTVDAVADVTDGLNDARKVIKRTDALVDASKAAKNVGNVAVAFSDIEGLPNEFVAHSKISRLGDKGGNLYNFSLLKEKRSFSNYIEEGDDRVVDTEAKILKDIYSRVKDKNITGIIYLYTELSPCPSCQNIIKEFNELLPNVTLKVFYGQGNLSFDGTEFLK